MKAKTILSLIGCVVFTLTTKSSFSQQTIKQKDLNKDVAISANQKNNFVTSGDKPFNFSVSIRRRIQESFAGYFASATGQNWTMAGHNFHCSFSTNGIPASVLFDKNGHLIYAITYGEEKDMPSAVRKIVKRVYYDYVITLAMEVKQNKKDVWVVNMKNNSTYITVRIEDGEMEQVEQFNLFL